MATTPLLLPDNDTAAFLLTQGLNETKGTASDPKPEDRSFREFKRPGQPLRIWVDKFAGLIWVREGATWYYDGMGGIPRKALEFALTDGLKTKEAKANFTRLAKVK